MEETKWAAKDASSAIKVLQLDPPRNPVVSSPSIRPLALPFRKKKAQRLVSLCIGVLGQHLEDIIADILEIAAEFPADIKLVLLAIARRRQLLNDDVLVALADNMWEILDISGSNVTDIGLSKLVLLAIARRRQLLNDDVLVALADNLWEILDISGSNVTDIGLSKVSQICTNLRAVDISRCDKITVAGVTGLFDHCRSLATLRCGGSPRSEFTARRCLSILKPKLDNLDGESWEELEIMDIGNGAQSLRWLVWPKIDEDSKMTLATECSRICVNPQGSIGVRGVRVPAEAMHSVALDHHVVEDIDPKTWAVSGISHARKTPIASAEAEAEAPEMSIAEKFRLAFMERDAKLAPKRAKNARQHRRRAEKELLMSSTTAKSLALASQAGKFLNNRS
ncbi:hypothetical protein MA16_Dca005426 [Dendrobium catenatum]|uniref:RNI-like superfamily protein n=1 Tax=Dendrobium catenatum TaxID=906689 RepID=A0A2I0X3F2_9ASPA|nr:hypothetical protein MA16_Dca005426 [Dendrobium catenatum]